METQLTEEQINEQVKLGMMVFEVMGMEGDVKTIWDPSDPVELEEARNQFARLTKEKKCRAYRVLDNGEKGDLMTTFEPGAARIIYAAAFQGG